MSQIHRRGFLSAIIAAGVGAALPDPERLLWSPSEKAIFLPPAGGWYNPYGAVDWGLMEHDSLTLITPEWVGEEVLRIFGNQLAIADRVNQTYDRLKIGHTIDIIYGGRRAGKTAVVKALADHVDKQVLEHLYSEYADRYPKPRSR